MSKAGGVKPPVPAGKPSIFVPDYDAGTAFEAQCAEALDHVHTTTVQGMLGVGLGPPNKMSTGNPNVTGGESSGALPLIPHTTRKAMMDRAAAPPVKPTLRGSSANRGYFPQDGGKKFGDAPFQSLGSLPPSQGAGGLGTMSPSAIALAEASVPSGGVTEPELGSFMDRNRRVGGEFSASLLSRMVSSAISASVGGRTPGLSGGGGGSVAVTANDVARCVQTKMPYGADWVLLVEFLLQHKDLQDGVQAKKKSNEVYRPPPQRPQTQQVVGGRSLKKSSIVTPGRFTPRQPSATTEMGGTMTSWGSKSAHQGEGGQSPSPAAPGGKGAKSADKKPILDYLPFKEAKHPAWSVHYDAPIPSKPQSSLLGDGIKSSASPRNQRINSLTSTITAASSDKQLLEMQLSSPMALEGLEDGAVVCCRTSRHGRHQLTPAESMEALIQHPAGVRAVLVDLNRVMKGKGEHFNPTIACHGLCLGSTLPNCWSPSPAGKKKPKKQHPSRTDRQAHAINSIIAYIER